MDQNGWIKLYRSTLENPIVCKDGDHLAIWIYLLLNATHESRPSVFAGEKIILKPGQLITGRKVLSFTLNINEHKVQRVLKTFEIEQQITQQPSNKNRLITVLNWDKYQSDAQQSTQQVNSDRTTDAQQLHTNKNEKNERIDIYSTFFERIWVQYPNKRGKGRISDKKKKELYEQVGEEQFERCIQRYVDDLSQNDWRKPQNGSTFFNSGYVDYLDVNYSKETAGHERMQRCEDGTFKLM